MTQQKCCTPEGQIKRYVDCIGCDRRPDNRINMAQQNLYRLTAPLGDYWVSAAHPTEAQDKLLNILDTFDYGFRKDRKVTTIELIAEGICDSGILTNKLFIN